MARIKIEDLPVLEDLSPKEVKGIFGGSLSRLRGDQLGILVEGDPPQVGTFSSSLFEVDAGFGG